MPKDSENLDDLPLGDKDLDEDSRESMEAKFGPPKKIGWGLALKLALVMTFVFLVFANPWVDKVFCFVPGCGKSPAMTFAAKPLLFFAIATGVVKYVG